MFRFGIRQATNASRSHLQRVCFQQSVQLSCGTRRMRKDENKSEAIMQMSLLSTKTFPPIPQESICSLKRRKGADPPLDRSRGVIHLAVVSFVSAVREDYHN